MKIHNLSKKNSMADLVPGQLRTGKASDTTATSASTSDQVSISAQSHSLVSQAGGGDMVFDAARVQEIKAAIAAGQFKVNTEQIADGLINTVKDLLRARTD